MWHLAIKQIFHERMRSLLIICAVSSSIAMILILRGFEQGLYSQSEKVVLDRGGQLILTQEGVGNFLAVRSSLPQLTRSEVEAVPGVANAHPLTGFWVIYGPEGNKFPLLLLVYDTLGGPTHLIEGNHIQGSRDVVVDLGLSRRFDLRPGDLLVISEFEFRVAGITSGSSALFSTFAFVSYDGMIDLFLESEIAPDISTFPLLSFLLVELMSDTDPIAVAEGIEQTVDTVDVFTPETLAQNDVELGRELFGPIMSVLISLSYVIGLLVIGLIIYSDVGTRRQQYGIMKALGFRLSGIAGGAVLQTALLVLVSFPIGVLLAWATGSFIEYRLPVYTVRVIDDAGLIKTLVGVIIIIPIACLMPLRIIRNTDPVIVFQESAA